MIENKVQFVQQSIGRVRSQLQAREAELASLTNQESELLQSVSALGTFTDLNKIHAEISKLRENRGEKVGLVSRIEEIEQRESEVRESLTVANESIVSNQRGVDKRVEQFNRAFSEYSNNLYGDKYILYYDSREVNGTKRFEFKIANATGNEGTGKKRAQIAAFDLAYLKTQSELHAETVRFTLHDRLETISKNQLQTLFEIAEEIDGQFLVCVLADKLVSLDSALIDKATILKLSQSDKFFRIP